MGVLLPKIYYTNKIFYNETFMYYTYKQYYKLQNIFHYYLLINFSILRAYMNKSVSIKINNHKQIRIYAIYNIVCLSIIQSTNQYEYSKKKYTNSI